MYRSYLLKNEFWAKKGDESNGGGKIFMKHDVSGPIYAFIQNGEKKGVKIVVNREEYFFDNFNKLDEFLTKLKQAPQDDFMKILARKDISKRLRMLEI